MTLFLMALTALVPASLLAVAMRRPQPQKVAVRARR